MSNLSLTRFSRCTKCGCTKPAMPEFFHARSRRKSGVHEWCRVCRRLERLTGVHDHLSTLTAMWLRQRYKVERMTMQQVADLVGCAVDTVRMKLMQFGIESRPHKEKFYEDYRLQRNLITSRRRAQLMNAKGSISNEEIQQMYKDQGGLCAYCEVPLFGNFHIEHMVPLSRGGSNEWQNIALACPWCNKSKGAKTVEEFMAC